MAVVATLLESRRAVLALRRSLPAGAARSTVSCRTPAALHRLLESRLVDALVVNPVPALPAAISELRKSHPALPVIAYAPFRPDDGSVVVACREARVSALAVEGVDDAVVGDLVARHSMTTARRLAMADAPRVLRLTEPLQRTAWHYLLGAVEKPVRTAALARELAVSREHLSRQFGAGGAPNLKRVIDLTRVAAAAQLLRNPGMGVPAVVRLLHFASPSHLGATARRIAGTGTSGLGALGPRGVLSAFVKGNTRSRA
ncbi:MAG TPA: helix-turn-helix domain-containing protein [Gemmatimonadales bacterium]